MGRKCKLFPDDYIESVYDVDFEALYRAGYRGIIFDIDNTLVEHGAPADFHAIRFFGYLRKCGFKTLLISNNKEYRVKTFAEAVLADHYIYKAGKPMKKAYIRSIRTMGIKRSEALFIGDQIFTDTWGASRAGICSVLVKPVHKWKEEPQIILKRLLEAVVLWVYGWTRRWGGQSFQIPLKGER